MNARGAAVAGAALLALAIAPTAAPHDGAGAWWTLEQARRFAAAARVSGVDATQLDRPTFTLALRGGTVAPLGPRVRNRWRHFRVRATGRDADTRLALRVSFVLHPVAGGGHELTEFRGPAPDRSQPRFPIRTTFEYAWYPEAWSRDGGASVFSRYTPSLGLYDTSLRALAARHVAAMRYGNVDAATYSWWGRGTTSDTRFANFLDVARQTPFRWAAYYELEGYGDPTVEQLRADLQHLRDTYFAHPAYLRIGGKPVVFAYGQERDEPCSVAARWAAANDVGAYVQLYTPTLYPSRENLLETVTAFSPLLPNGIALAAGDLDGDGRAEIATAGGSAVRIFDGETRAQLSAFAVAGEEARVAIGGRELVVATRELVTVHGKNSRTIDATAAPHIAAGDLTSDGRAEVVVSFPDRVEVWDARTLATLTTFAVPALAHAFVAVGDVDGDGRNEVVLTSGRDAAPQVEVVDVAGNALYGPWPAYFPSMRGGLNVATGDTDGDGVDEIVLGADRGGSATETWRLAGGTAHRVAAFFGWDFLSGPWGTRVAVADVNGNGVDEVILGGGPGRPSEIAIHGGYTECAVQPSAWHQYAVPFDGGVPLGRDTFVVSPGFWMAADDAPRLVRDLGRWRRNVRAMVASGAPWQLVISFNEWPEGTAVESAEEWATPSGYGAYLDVLHSSAR